MSNPFSAKPSLPEDSPPQPIAPKAPPGETPFPGAQSGPETGGYAGSPPEVIPKKTAVEDQAPAPINSAPIEAPKPEYTPPPLERAAVVSETNREEEKAEPEEKLPTIPQPVTEAEGKHTPQGASRQSSHHGTPPPLRMEEVSCRTCRYFAHSAKNRTAASEGECRCKAPAQGNAEFATWPMVRWESWCGEWILGVSDEEMIRMARAVADEVAHGPAGGFRAARTGNDEE
ncbi:MAG: hypothetical protein P1U87_11485 [Verrucomicrobiales bacterium]|nr:hypothetical protein [Verrucomicrobiales bacterium]